VNLFKYTIYTFIIQKRYISFKFDSFINLRENISNSIASVSEPRDSSDNAVQSTWLHLERERERERKREKERVTEDNQSSKRKSSPLLG